LRVCGRYSANTNSQCADITNSELGQMPKSFEIPCGLTEMLWVSDSNGQYGGWEFLVLGPGCTNSHPRENPGSCLTSLNNPDSTNVQSGPPASTMSHMCEGEYGCRLGSRTDAA
jgi:hypothetical protein